MKTFRIRTYQIESRKMKPGKKVRFALIADLHGVEPLCEGKTILQVIQEGEVDGILVLGDMIVSSQPQSLERAEELLVNLVRSHPVCYAPGNHEYLMSTCPEHQKDYQDYENRLSCGGVRFLHNSHTVVNLAETDFVIYGLELPWEYYRKPISPRLSLTAMEEMLGLPSGEGIQILLAHNPKYGSTYFSWGADLILSGHYHGGVLRLGEHTGLTSPQFLLFPPFCCGDFHRGEKHMLVSAGLGEHTIPVRIHNPRELIFMDIRGKEKSHGDSGEAADI